MFYSLTSASRSRRSRMLIGCLVHRLNVQLSTTAGRHISPRRSGTDRAAARYLRLWGISARTRASRWRSCGSLLAGDGPGARRADGAPAEVLADCGAARRACRDAGRKRPSLFYVAMLAWVGCVADDPEVAASFGDDIAFRADSYYVDLAGFPAFGFVSRAGAGGSVAQRLRAATLVATGGSRVARGIQGHCITTSALSDRLGLDAEVAGALRQFFARWDGRGVPPDLRGRISRCRCGCSPC